MTHYENTSLQMSPLDEALYEVAVLRQQLEDERQAHLTTRGNMAWQIVELKAEVRGLQAAMEPAGEDE